MHQAGDVVDRGAGDRQGADLGAQQPALGEDPGEHGNAVMLIAAPMNSVNDKNGTPGSPIGWMYTASTAPSAKGAMMPALLDQHGRTPASAEQTEVHLEADQEHEQHQPELAEHAEDAEAGRREQRVPHPGRDQAEQRRPEQHPRDDLRDHQRLMDLAGQHAEQARAGDDHHQLGDEQGERAMQQERQGRLLWQLAPPVKSGLNVAYHGPTAAVKQQRAASRRMRPSARTTAHHSGRRRRWRGRPRR